MESGLGKLLDLALKGNPRATGRLLTLLEDLSGNAGILLERLASMSKGAHIIGITGIPGAGKSTLISKLIREFRRRGYRVAVAAIDPSSPISQGALMGDRLRMQEHATDPGVFIRSLSTRGLKGGLSLAALAMIEAFDALGYDKVIVETVGVGQAEVDIMHAAHTIIVVTMPGAGDDIQALKAGVMEIGDIYVVNKSDKPEAAKTVEYINFVIESGELGSQRAGWVPRVVKTSAIMGQGVADLADVIDEHYKYLKETGSVQERIISRRVLLMKLLAESMLSRSLELAIEDLREKLRETARHASGLTQTASELARRACQRL